MINSSGNFRDHNAGSEMLSKLAHPCPIQTIENPILAAIVVHTKVSSGFREAKSIKTLLVSPPRIVQWISCFGPSSKRHYDYQEHPPDEHENWQAKLLLEIQAFSSYWDGL